MLSFFVASALESCAKEVRVFRALFNVPNYVDPYA